ncbi:SHOCT domain-containing protein [Citreicella sp. C3M06]|uniref:SHOCT domain-containing protein n=1 Tax=Citreicella sp. C3M06 TaxID=2841564 RepID=UPI001C083CA4|nr:SHOCT domain-containing protein [Citreicella sp. C3M06]MBU2962852.1 SHOCT domain-containing protein [Citreicella sp. C3M06]
MTRLTQDGAQAVSEIAGRYGVSMDAAETLLNALANGGGTQAQFSHNELGGMGQWSLGGMTMVGDMFNNGLKATVDGLCTELSNLMNRMQVFKPAPAPYQPQMGSQSQSQSSGGGSSLFIQGGSFGSQWPAELGSPSSTGSQNNLRYAVFPQSRRLAIDFGGRIEVYDTGDHMIGGVSQQQSGDMSLTFTSQYGTVRVADLPRVSLSGEQPQSPPQPSYEAPQPQYQEPQYQEPQYQQPDPQPQAQPAAAPSQGGNQDDVIGLIRKLADLRDSGILSPEEFEAKKQDLLSRL